MDKTCLYMCNLLAIIFQDKAFLNGLPAESVLQVEGIVQRRPAGQENPVRVLLRCVT